MVYWFIGLLVYWFIGLLVYWFIGLLVFLAMPGHATPPDQPWEAWPNTLATTNQYCFPYFDKSNARDDRWIWGCHAGVGSNNHCSTDVSGINEDYNSILGTKLSKSNAPHSGTCPFSATPFVIDGTRKTGTFYNTFQLNALLRDAYYWRALGSGKDGSKPLFDMYKAASSEYWIPGMPAGSPDFMMHVGMETNPGGGSDGNCYASKQSCSCEADSRGFCACFWGWDPSIAAEYRGNPQTYQSENYYNVFNSGQGIHACYIHTSVSPPITFSCPDGYTMASLDKPPASGGYSDYWPPEVNLLESSAAQNGWRPPHMRYAFGAGYMNVVPVGSEMSGREHFTPITSSNALHFFPYMAWQGIDGSMPSDLIYGPEAFNGDWNSYGWLWEMAGSYSTKALLSQGQEASNFLLGWHGQGIWQAPGQSSYPLVITSGNLIFGNIGGSFPVAIVLNCRGPKATSSNLWINMTGSVPAPNMSGAAKNNVRITTTSVTGLDSCSGPNHYYNYVPPPNGEKYASRFYDSGDGGSNQGDFLPLGDSTAGKSMIHICHIGQAAIGNGSGFINGPEVPDESVVNIDLSTLGLTLDDRKNLTFIRSHFGRKVQGTFTLKVEQYKSCDPQLPSAVYNIKKYPTSGALPAFAGVSGPNQRLGYSLPADDPNILPQNLDGSNCSKDDYIVSCDIPISYSVGVMGGPNYGGLGFEKYYSPEGSTKTPWSDWKHIWTSYGAGNEAVPPFLPSKAIAATMASGLKDLFESTLGTASNGSPSYYPAVRYKPDLAKAVCLSGDPDHRSYVVAVAAITQGKNFGCEDPIKEACGNQDAVLNLNIQCKSKIDGDAVGLYSQPGGNYCPISDASITDHTGAAQQYCFAKDIRGHEWSCSQGRWKQEGDNGYGGNLTCNCNVQSLTNHPGWMDKPLSENASGCSGGKPDCITYCTKASDCKGS